MEAVEKMACEGLPAWPQLPRESAGAVNDKCSIIRNECKLGRTVWNEIQKAALVHRVSSLSVLLSAFGEILGRWNSGCDLTMLVTNGFDEKVSQSEVIPVAFRSLRDERWIDICRKTGLQLEGATICRRAAGSSVLHNIDGDSRLDNGAAIVVFSSDLLAFRNSAGKAGNTVVRSDINKEYYFRQMQLRACLCCHVSERDEGISIVWEMFEGYFPQCLPDAMLESYQCLLNWLAEENWEKSIPDFVPVSQQEVREKTNATVVPVVEKCIHQDFFIHARKNPEHEALFWSEGKINRSMTYGELADRALRMAALLIEKGVAPGEAVAVTLPKGPDQVIAVLAVLAAGAAYVPVGVDQPEGRRNRIYRLGGIRRLITDYAGFSMLSDPGNITVILSGEADKLPPLPHPVAISTDALAYIIFTSGSTGEPKGVEITHKAAFNTILDINKRFSVNQSDRVLAVSALDFDLSVYDLFGLLSAGGGVVLPDESARREAPVWLDLIGRMKVTVWNSVPALLDMLMIAAGEKALPDSLRLVLVSGDWVGLDLYGRLMKKSPICRFIALGGATEASIWSNFFEVTFIDPLWTSIPYGKPLSNQYFRVVDRIGRDCPDMVAGELWIGGIGVARGYRGNPELTDKSFIELEDRRWYCTGDLGRYWPDGNIEFLGRADQQVKLRGYRIELGEIEAVLRQYPEVSQAAAAIAANAGSKQLVAAVVAEFVPVQIHPVSAVSSDSRIMKSLSREMQAKIVEALMVEILSLAELGQDAQKNLSIIEKLQITDGYRPLLQMWLCWLDERQVINAQQGGLLAGPAIREALQYAESLKTGTSHPQEVTEHNSHVLQIGRRLFERLDMYRGILSGKVSAAILLDDDILSPESLAARDQGTIEGIQLIAEKIKHLAKAAGKPIKAALIGGRSGILALRLLEMLDPGDIRFTLLDSAPAMVEAARRRLSSLFHPVTCQRLPDSHIPAELRYSFDVVLAINSLHCYRDPNQGIAVASLLVRQGGRVFALEHSELTPVAAVTAAVLDKAFADFDFERRQAYSPMLPAWRWEKMLMKAGFHHVNSSSVKGSFTELIEGSCPTSRTELDAGSILEFAAKHLPAHMLPEKIEVLPWIPLSANGKIDRTAIAAVFTSGTEVTSGEEMPAGMERQIAEIWKILLDINAVGRNQGFFEIGGDSLLATRFLAAVKEEFGVELPLRQLIEAPSLSQVAAALEGKLSEVDRTMECMEEGEI
jgi:dihydroaeruginoic acid synthetase